jgi:squalene cyclase
MTEQPEHRHAARIALLDAVKAAQRALEIDLNDTEDDGAWRQYWTDILHELTSFSGNQWRIMTDDDLCEECGQPRDGCICVNREKDE